jgi:hypothetical protein
VFEVVVAVETGNSHENIEEIGYNSDVEQASMCKSGYRR